MKQFPYDTSKQLVEHGGLYRECHYYPRSPMEFQTVLLIYGQSDNQYSSIFSCEGSTRFCPLLSVISCSLLLLGFANLYVPLGLFLWLPWLCLLSMDEELKTEELSFEFYPSQGMIEAVATSRTPSHQCSWNMDPVCQQFDLLYQWLGLVYNMFELLLLEDIHQVDGCSFDEQIVSSFLDEQIVPFFRLHSESSYQISFLEQFQR